MDKNENTVTSTIKMKEVSVENLCKYILTWNEKTFAREVMEEYEREKKLIMEHYKTVFLETIRKDKIRTFVHKHTKLLAVPLFTIALFQRKKLTASYYREHFNHLFNHETEFMGIDARYENSHNGRIRYVYNNIDQIRAIYSELADQKSKEILNALLHMWLFNNFEPIGRLSDCPSEQYVNVFDTLPKASTYIDVGGCVGEATKLIIDRYGEHIGKIIFYEPSYSNIIQAKKRLDRYGERYNILFRQLALSNKNYCTGLIGEGSTSRLTESVRGSSDLSDGSRVYAVSLDENLDERIAFIKIDVEGSEKNVIKGAEKHIKDDVPRIAISVYHNVSDITEIYRAIKMINSDYKIYLRHYSNFRWAESVMYFEPR